MDYGHPLEFGYFLIPEAGDPGTVLEITQVADRLGYDLLAVQDHPDRPAHLDALALLGMILGQTDQIRVFQERRRRSTCSAAAGSRRASAAAASCAALRYRLDGGRPGPVPAHETPAGGR